MALGKLEELVPDEANIFNQAIEAAKNDLANYLKGGVKQFFKNLAGDPVLKATSFANAIRAGLANLPAVAKIYLPKGADKETQRSVMELIPKEKQQQFVQQMVKAFEPQSAVDVKSLFSGTSMPYVKNMNAAVQELLQNLAPNAGFKLAQQVAAQPAAEVQQASAPQGQNAEQPGQTTTATPGTTNAPTTGAEPTQSSTATNATIETEPTKAAKAPTPQKKLNPKTDADRIENISYFLASQTGIDKAAAQKLITKLAELNGLTDIPTPQKPSNKLAAQAPPAAGTSTKA